MSKGDPYGMSPYEYLKSFRPVLSVKLGRSRYVYRYTLGPDQTSFFSSAMVQLQHVVAASSLADKQHVLSQRNLQTVDEIIQLIFDKRLMLPNNASANTTLDRTISLRRQILSGPTGMNQQRRINGLSSIHS